MESKGDMKFPEKPRLIFMGTPDFAVPSLNALVKNGYDVISVVSQPDRPKGRGRKILSSPVKQAAMDFGLEILQPEKVSAPEFCKEMRLRNPDAFIVVAFGQILKSNLLNTPSWGAINIHASLLPRYRGASPIHCAILNNETKSGLTAMKMDEGLDTGPILLQEDVEIRHHETAGQLHDRLAQISGKFLVKTLKMLSEGRITQTLQNEKIASYSSKIDSRMAHVNWDQPAQKVSAFIRALDPWPGAFAYYKGKKIKLFLSRTRDNKMSGTVPGRIFGSSGEALEVETGKGNILITEIQAPGKRRLPAREFLKGFSLEKNSILG